MPKWGLGNLAQRGLREPSPCAPFVRVELESVPATGFRVGRDYGMTASNGSSRSSSRSTSLRESLMSSDAVSSS